MEEEKLTKLLLETSRFVMSFSRLFAPFMEFADPEFAKYFREKVEEILKDLSESEEKFIDALEKAVELLEELGDKIEALVKEIKEFGE